MFASTLLRAGITTAAILLLALTGSALAAQSSQRKPTDAAPPWVTSGFDSGAAAALTGRSGFARQHGGEADHLPAARENIELVGKLKVDTPAQYRTPEHNLPVEEGQIADLAIYKQAAYLNSWAQPAEADETCHRGGFFSADISDPAHPRQLAFVPALPETYHGEGAHVVTFNGRDILAVNNEPCGENGVGGFDLYDVTNPAQPTTLVQGVGDQSTDLPDGVGLGDTTQVGTEVPNSNHSIFLWQDGSKLYAVTVDNTELHDVDIFDVTNPAAPEFIADIDLVALADEQGFELVDPAEANGTIFHHDMVVKKIGSVQTMLVSYWDAGYVKLNVNDPASPTFIGDSDFGDTDPLRPEVGVPEGNGHQSEFSHDNSFVLAADEDFAAYRPGTFAITDGPNAGEYESVSVGGGASAALLPDQTMNGPTVYGGYGCDGSAPIPPRADQDLDLAPGEEAIIVLQRGPLDDPAAPEESCFPGEKAENGIAAGYDAVLLTNRHGGSVDGNAYCGSGGYPAEPPIVTVCTTHQALHFIFDEPGEDVDTLPIPAGHGPDVGAHGRTVSADSLFDGWGYMHLFKNTAGDLEPIADFAIEEAQDERFALGFGDLSVHEWATDPDVNVGYVAHYAGGMRVFTFGDGGVQETGKFIDKGGNNFWGVEVFTTPQGERLFAGSDRDSGLYLFKYTGPGAFQPPAPAAPAAPSAGAPPALQATGCGNQILGTAARDLIAGTDGSDTIRSATGDDVIDAKKADDCVFGEDGDDSLDGEDGNDRIDGGAGADQLKGGDGNDALNGNAGVDRITGGNGADRLGGGAKRDILSGGGGADVLFGSTGNDTPSGGSGNDRISGGTGNDRISGNAGADRITPGKGKDRVIAGKGKDRIFARDGKKDRISCGSGRDRVTADKVDVLTGCERVSRR